MAEPELSTIQQKFGENESEFDLGRGAARIFEKFVVVPTGIEPETIKTDCEREEAEAIDVTKLKKDGE